MDSPILVAYVNGSVTVTPGGDNVSVTISFTDEQGQSQVVTVTKQADGSWKITTGNLIGVTLDPNTGTVMIASDRLKDDYPVVAQSRDDVGNTVSASAIAQAKPTEVLVRPKPATKRLPNTGDASNAGLLKGGVLLLGATLLTKRKKRQSKGK